MAVVLLLAGMAQAQSFVSAGTASLDAMDSSRSFSNIPDLSIPAAAIRLSPEQALRNFQERAKKQDSELGSYSDTTIITADLPDSSQHGEYELERRYTAPNALTFKSVHFDGDGFVKKNVIVRLLQSEADHVQKQDGAQYALDSTNYKFTCKGATQISGRDVLDFQVSPRHKRMGLFQGHIYLDASTGNLVRTAGKFVKSPSFFIKKIEFTQDYADLGPYTLPANLHSVAQARMIGRAVVDVQHRDYQARSLAEVEAAAAHEAGTAGGSH